MGRASLTIAISGSYNGKAVERAEKSLERLAIRAAAVNGGVGASLAGVGGKVAEAGGRIYNAGQQMADMGDSLTRNVTVPIVAGAAVAVQAATDLDTAFTNVRKTVDMDAESLEALKQGAIEMSKVQPVSAEDILNAEALGGQLGIANENLEDFARVVSGLDIATDMELEDAAMNLAQFANIVGMDQSNMERYGSTIVALGNNFATTESAVSDMAMRVAAAGHQVGMSEADILGLSTALTSMGISAEAGGTAISTIMSQIDKDVAFSTDGISRWADAAGVSTDEFIARMSEGGKWAKDFAESQGMTLSELTEQTAGSLQSLGTWAETAGMSAEAFAAAWKRDPVDALSAVLTGMDGAVESGGNMAVMLEDLGITSIRQTDTMKRLASNSTLLGDAVDMANQAWEENSALQAEVDNRNDSLASKFQVLQNRAHAVAAEVGEPLADALLEALEAAEPLIHGVEDAARAFSEADEGTQRMVVSMVAAAAAAGPLLSVTGRLTKGVGGVVVGVGKGIQTMGTFAGALTTTNYKAVEAYKKAGTLATKLGLAGNKAVRAAGGVDAFVTAEKKAAKAAGDAAKEVAEHGTESAGLASKAGSAAAGVAKLAGAFGVAVVAVAAANAAIKEATGFNDLVEGAERARAGLGDFAGAFEGVEPHAANFDLAMSTSGQSVSDLQGTVDESMRTIASTIEENLTNAGVITEEGAQRIADALQASLDATAQKAEGYGAVIQAYGETVGDSLDATSYAQYVTDVNSAFEQGADDLDATLQQQVQAIYAAHQAMGDVGSAAYEADLQAAKDAHASALGELESYRDEAIRTAGGMFGELTPELEQGWSDAAAATKTFDDGMRGWAASSPVYSQFARDSVAGDFARLTTDLDSGATGAWLAVQAATVAAGGELDAASAQNVANILGAFDGLPDYLSEDGTAAMQALAASVEAAGVDLGDTSNMSGQQIVDALRGKFGELPPAAAEVSAQTQASLAAGLANTSRAQAAASTLSRAVDGSLGGMAATSLARGSAASAGVASGLNSGRGGVSAAAQSLARAQQAANVSGSAYSWGSHLGSNIASGLRGALGAVGSAASDVASRIAAYLKHTTPEMGPLADDDLWGGHLVANVADGMVDGIPELRRAAMADAAAIERAFAPDLAAPAYAKGPGLSAGATTWANRADQYVAAGAGNTYNLYLDGRALPLTDRVRGAVEVIFDEVERARASYVG